MAMSSYDCCLLISVVIFLVLDIVLALCLRTVLPPYITQHINGGWYPAHGQALPFDEAVNLCPCLRQVFPRGSNTPIKFNKIPKKAWAKRSVNNDLLLNQMEKYLYFVSLSLPSYWDDIEDKIFACNGIVQSDEWLLTTKNCVKDYSEWYNITVRSGSVYWSKLGQEHTVVDIANTLDEHLIRLKVQPKFAENILPYPPIKYSYGGNWTYAFSLGWDDRTCRKKINTRYKYKPYHVKEWTSKNVGSNCSRICPKITNNCNGVSSRFLLTSCHQLIGLKMAGGKDCNGYLQLGNNLNKDKKVGCNSICRDTHTLKDAEICQN